MVDGSGLVILFFTTHDLLTVWELGSELRTVSYYTVDAVKLSSVTLMSAVLSGTLGSLGTRS